MLFIGGLWVNKYLPSMNKLIYVQLKNVHQKIMPMDYVTPRDVEIANTHINLDKDHQEILILTWTRIAGDKWIWFQSYDGLYLLV